MAHEFFTDPAEDSSGDNMPTQAEALEACARARRAQRDAALEIIETCGRTEQAAIELIQDALGRAQLGIDQSPGKAGRECRRGCAFCCYQYVEVHPFDAIGVAQQLQRTLSPEQRAAVEDRLRDRVRRKRTMAEEDRQRANIPCALLADDNTCSVYETRPLACRGYNSLSVQQCEQAYLNPAAPNRTPFDYHARIWTASVADGMRDALEEKGIDAKRYELNSAVLCALTTPDVATKWLAGQDVFRDCLIDRQRQAPPRPAATPRPTNTPVGRNDPCPCGSGKKFKKCCMVNRA
jgi:Fe-S-cluster containining protein